MELAEPTDLLCELVEDPKPQWAQTYVFKGPPAAFEPFRTFLRKSDFHASVMRVHRLRQEVFKHMNDGGKNDQPWGIKERFVPRG